MAKQKEIGAYFSLHCGRQRLEFGPRDARGTRRRHVGQFVGPVDKAGCRGGRACWPTSAGRRGRGARRSAWPLVEGHCKGRQWRLVVVRLNEEKRRHAPSSQSSMVSTRGMISGGNMSNTSRCTDAGGLFRDGQGDGMRPWQVVG
ncbi:hypothetical protein CDD82_5113 [Ophiocordyceps australis]|uniref:Uncharacterized protein n=1 Tax=Ophiocordyceps australis TaxID=1399860 RepID=A0A2C5Z4F9_9HYPO|nr:hypothetical protein CDD82_5113 [Ophiocordyceps australis]